MVRSRVGVVVWLAMVLLAGCSLPQRGGPTGPTPVPEPPQVVNLPGRGVTVQGHGSATSEPLVPDYTGGIPIGIDLLTLTHDGQSSFIVTAIEGDQSTNVAMAIGAYNGQRPLVVEGPVAFQVVADGAWTLKVEPLASGGQPAFQGTGDRVSQYFNPPSPTTWSVSHDGQTSFLVSAHCLGGSIVVEDRTGAVQDRAQVEFPRGPCFWEVRADGAFTLQPTG